jgi:hypothetical protein
MLFRVQITRDVVVEASSEQAVRDFDWDDYYPGENAEYEGLSQYLGSAMPEVVIDDEDEEGDDFDEDDLDGDEAEETTFDDEED